MPCYDPSRSRNMSAPEFPSAFEVRPIGVVRSPFSDRLEAPRQPRAAPGGEGRIELFPASGVEHALEDLASFRYVWILFWFHLSPGFRPKVLPPRSRRRRGLFATRSPHRPNPIGMSAVELLGIEGLTLFVRDLDIVDGTPVLDVKPYVPYADAIGDASNGWLDAAERPEDPLAAYAVVFSPRALEALEFLEREHGLSLRQRIEPLLALGPQPHAYRRIKRDGDGFVLAYKEWRFGFRVEDRTLHVWEVRSGYRASELFGSDDARLAVHRAFAERFGA